MSDNIRFGELRDAMLKNALDDMIADNDYQAILRILPDLDNAKYYDLITCPLYVQNGVALFGSNKVDLTVYQNNG